MLWRANVFRVESRSVNHVQIVEDVIVHLGLDPKTETPGRKVVRHIGASLAQAMEMALAADQPEAAQIVAAEAIVPLNSEAGRSVGARAQLILFLDDLIPSLFGKPLLTH